MTVLKKINDDLIVDDMVYRPNLTEKWNKGKLPEGFYWVEFQDGEILPTTFSNQHGFICCDSLCDEENIKQILAKMPSFREYQKLLSDQLAKDEGVEINAELENRINLERELCKRVLEENAQLKAVLKECYLINEAAIHTFNWLETIVTPSQKHICPKVVGGINKTQQSIKQALGEE